MRNIETVLNNIIEVIKKEDENSEEIIKDLQKVIYDASFSAPEVMSRRWNQAYYILMDYLVNDKTQKLYNDKQFGIKVFSIFSGNSEEDIRKELL